MEMKEFEEIVGSDTVTLEGYGANYPLTFLSRPPCSTGCPAGINVKAYVNLISKKMYEDALSLVLDSNPFPGICGRVCTRPCEHECSSDGCLSQIHIRELKRFIADVGTTRREIAPRRNEVRYSERVAIVGSGPAGLTAASDLSGMGYPVTVFEKEDSAGGMMVQCIPRYRLPEGVVKDEIRNIISSGVNLVTGRDVVDTGTLFDQGFSAVLLAMGATRDRDSGIPGREKEGVLECLPFLRDVNRGNAPEMSGRVVVIGGGSSAFDAARTALRCGAHSVTLAYRRSEEEMPADEEELKGAREEGVSIITLAMPKEIVGRSVVEGVVFLRCELGEPGEDGRRMFRPIEGSDFSIPADVVIPAIGYMPDIEGFAGEVDITKWGTVNTDGSSRAGENIFAAGDAVTGPSTIVDAICSGHAAAGSIHSALRGLEGHKERFPKMMGVGSVDEDAPTPLLPECVSPGDRLSGFCEVSRGYRETEAVNEASRCRSCGSCFECAVCLNSCEWGQVYGTVEGMAIILKVPNSLRERVHNGAGDWSLSWEGGKGRIGLESLIPKIDGELCIGCGSCESTCPYNAVQVRMRKDHLKSAVIDVEACRNCGICVYTCPSAAITQGPLSQHVQRKKIRGSIENKTGEPAVMTSYWDNDNLYLHRNVIEPMCLRTALPGLMLEALSSGASGLLLFSSPGDGDDHYISSSRSLADTLEASKHLLAAADIDPARLDQISGDWSHVEKERQIFAARLESAGISPPEVFPSTPIPNESPLVRALEQLEWLVWGSKSGDEKNVNIPVSSVRYFQILDSLLRAEGFPFLETMASSLQAMLMYLGEDGGKMTLGDISKGLANRVSGGRGPHSGAPGDVVEGTLEGMIEEKDERIAFLRCPDDAEFGGEAALELLGRLGVKVVEVDATRAGKEWLRFGKSSILEVTEMLARVEMNECRQLVTVSPFAVAALGIMLKGDSWMESRVSVKDIYSYLGDSGLLRGDAG